MNLAVITCFFSLTYDPNDVRLKNYYTFRKSIEKVGLDLFTVELAFDDNPYYIEAPNVTRVRSSSPMYMQEKLLNIGIEQISEDYDYLAWLDCDIIHSDYWPEKAISLLHKYKAIQLFDEIIYLGKNSNENYQKKSFVANRENPFEVTGGGWAYQAPILRKHMLFDLCVVGGGDTCQALAMKGEFELAKRFLSEPMMSCFLQWGTKLHEEIDDFGCLDMKVHHLWHARSNAIKRFRHRCLSDFDPLLDIAKNRDGCWDWNSAKKSLHDCVKKKVFLEIK